MTDTDSTISDAEAEAKRVAARFRSSSPSIHVIKGVDARGRHLTVVTPPVPAYERLSFGRASLPDGRIGQIVAITETL